MAELQVPVLNLTGESLEESPTTSAPSSPSLRPHSRRASMTSLLVKETRNAHVSDGANGERQVNQYILKRVLGRGSYGTVYFAMDTDLDDHVAIKEFSKSKLKRQQMSRMGGPMGRGGFRGGRGGGRGGGLFGRGPMGTGIVAKAESLAPQAAESSNPIDLVRPEIAILKKLNHRNVVKLYEVLDDPETDSLYMVFELCERGAVLDITMDKPTKPLDLETARQFFRQMILGIEYLHEHDIAHRDIKPDNMLVDGEGTLKLVDFGVSEMFTKDSDKLKKSAGSPAFFAPEMCVPQHGDMSARAADIWALGVTLFCMCFGRLPFTGVSIIDLYESIKNDPPPIPKDADKLLTDVLLKLLDKNPSTRITMDKLRADPWVTKNGTDLLPRKEDNCAEMVMEITEEELKSAVKGVSGLFTVLKAVNKLKKMGRSSSMLFSPPDGEPPASANTTSGSGSLVP
ncbi:hypothetical protein HDV00_003303 [Rhizophlyctis rosea]|nr:hypothetical protein HDV00_003303 [Rhizophlyctis rosea]